MADSIRIFQYHGEDSLSLPAEREASTTLKTWLSGIAAELELLEKPKRQLLIAADEIFTNIASYGYPHDGGTAKVQVAFHVQEQILTLTFIDSGIAYNPLESAPPDMSQPLAERNVGGLGLFLVKKMMDSISYRRENGHNILIIEKHLKRNGVQE